MIKEEKFDLLSSYLFILAVFASLSFTSILKHLIFYVLIFIFLIKKLVYKRSFLREIITSNWRLSFIAFLGFLIPIIIEISHGNFSIEDSPQLQWINPYNSWVIFTCYLFSSYFIKFSDKNFKNLAFKALYSSFTVEFIYSIIKWSISDFNFDRWQGSAGNPQLWAIQASFVLFIFLLNRKKIKWQFIVYLSIPAIILSGSISNIIGISFASLVLVINNGFITVSLGLVYITAANLLSWNFIQSNELNIEKLRSIFQGLAHKFIPRIRLWYKLLNYPIQEKINLINGMGFEDYRDFLKEATLNNHKNVHSLYLHNYLTQGFTGIYLILMPLINSLKDLINNKYLCALVLYIMTSSVFDCAITYLEIQIVFWIVFPLAFDKISKSSSGTDK